MILDSPKIVRRLIDALEALERAKERALFEGWSKRFASLYEESLQIIKQELLPKVHPSVFEQAASLDFATVIPRLE